MARLAAATTASVVLGGSSTNSLRDNAGGTLVTIGAGVTVTGGVGSIYVSQASSTLTIAGTVDAASPSKTVTIGNNARLTTITGFAKASAGILTLAGSWANSGTFTTQSGGTINLGGSFGYASVLGPRWNRSASDIVNLTGALAIGASNTLVLDAQTGPLRLVGGTLTGGTISDPGSRLVCTVSGGVLDGVTIPVGTVLDLSQVNNATCTLNNAVTIQGSVVVGKIDGSTYGRLYSGSTTSTWSGSGEVLFGASTSNQLQVLNVSSTLTIASPLRLHGMNAIWYANGSGSGIVNNGTIASDVAGGAFTINASTFTNHGSLTIGQGLAQTWNWTGNFTQSSTGVLDLNVGGTSAGQFDRLAFSGTSTISLGGTVRITSTNGFVPTAATSLDVLTIAAGSVSGSFATVQGAYSISYGSTKVTAIGLSGLSAPTVTLTSSASDPLLSGAFPVTATFSTPVTGFTAAGISASNATITNFSGSGSSYSFDLVPTVTQGLVQANVQAGAGISPQLLGTVASPVLQRFFNSVDPTLSSISPSGGPIAGGTSVIVSGSGFLAGQTTVTIGGNPASPTSVTASSFTLTTPAGANGPADVVVTVAGRSVTATGAYTYSTATPSLSSVLDPTEYNALTTFFSATGGSNWIAATGWNDATATSWLGVTEASGHVIGLTLPENNLTGAIPAILSAFPNLQVLDLSGNRLSGTIPPEVTTRTGLTQLNLARNQLVGLIPDGITALTGLNSLALDFNGLYTSGAAATETFLGQKQANWAATQTVQPSGLTVVNQGPDVLVSWSPITYTGDSGRYEIGYNTDGSTTYAFNAGNQSADKAGTQFLLTGLAAGTTYYFTVQTRTLAHGTQLNTVVSATPTQVTLTTSAPTTPSVTLSSTAGDPTISSPIPVTVTFSEPVTGFTLAGITVSNATVANLAGSGALYTFDLVPTVTQGSVQSSIAAAAATSSAFAIANTASSPLTRYYNGSDPTIVSITPATGLATGGTTVVIAGTNFVLGATTVQIGGTSATIGTVTSTSIQVTTPSGTGAADVVVQVAGRSATLTGGFTFEAIQPPPTVAVVSASVDPVTTAPIPVSVTFSQVVTGFVATDLVVSNATVQNFTGSGTSYTFDLLPTANLQGLVEVSVPAGVAVNAQGTDNLASSLLQRFYNGIDPVISSLTPSSGPEAGGTAVVITGSGFVPGSTSVTIGGVPAVLGTVTATSIALTVPPGTGTADVVVQSAGRSVTVGAAYNYILVLPAPTVALESLSADPVTTALIPVSVTFSQVVTGFVATDLVVSNATVQNFTGSGASYTFDLLPTANLQGLVEMSVPAGVAVNAQGTDNLASSLLQRFYNGVDPLIGTLTPATGPEAGGTAVVISGSGFVPGSTSVTIGGVPAVLGTVTATSIALTVPPGTGTADVVVQSAGRSVTVGAAYNYILVLPAPTVALESLSADPVTTALIPVSVTFSQVVTGFVATDLVVSNATVQNFTGSGNSYTFDLLPTANLQGLVEVSVPAGVAVNGQGTDNVASSLLQRFYNGVDPLIGTLTPATGPEAGGTAVVITGSGFVPGSTSVTIGGVSAALGTVTSTSLQLTTPPGSGVANVTVSSAGRSTTATSAFTYLLPAPTVALSSTASEPTSISPIPLTIVFSQPVSGFTVGSLTLINATAQNLSGSGSTYACELVPAVVQGAITVSVSANAVTNVQGTANLASAQLQRTYIAPPQLSITTPTVVAPEGSGAVSGSPAAVITVRLSAPSTQAVTVPFVVTGGTAAINDFTLLTTSPLTFVPGTLAQDIRLGLTVDGPDGSGGVPLDETLVLTLGTPVNADLGTSSTATVTIVDEEPFTADAKIGTGSLQPIPSGGGLPLTVSVGETITVRFANGIPPYTVVPSAQNRFFAYAPQYVGNTNATVDPDQQALIVALASGTSQIQLRDSGGTIYTLAVTATPLPSTTVPAPPVGISNGTQTLYGAICPGTSEGLTRLLAALSGRTSSDARAFWWDASGQLYREITGGETSGLTPTSAIFLATRTDLRLDFSGGAQPFYQELALPPGWSFVGLPPLGDGVAITTTHDWANLILFDAQGDQIAGSDRTALIGTGAYTWDGATYALATTLSSGNGYWIKNNSSPGQPLRLVRFPNGADVDGVSLRSSVNQRSLAYGHVPHSVSLPSRAYTAVDRGTPPAPPGSKSVTKSDEDGTGSCGSGGLAACLLLSLSLGYRRRRH